MDQTTTPNRQDLHEVRVIEHLRIPMPDGVHLAARVWLPVDAESEPVPAILEYIPYRKRDFTRSRDATMHPYFAARGYAGVRVDLRGSGDSEGVLTDEYLPQELEDGVAVIRWLAEQPWCNGRVGMIGISWGGFNGLQIAALQPEPLQAVVSVCSTDDRYADDVHYMGGCLLGDNLSWASVMFAYNSLPPDPELVGERWRDLWFQRLEGSGLWLETWLRHPHRDAYWRHGSICEDFSAVRCPVMAVSGWADGYTNAVFRLLENLPGPRQGLVGPWSHKYPHLGEPGPAIGFLQHTVRWWDRWLKNQHNGIDREPMLQAWLQESAPPYTRYRHRPGRWVAEDRWPSPSVRSCAWRLAADQALWREPAEPPAGELHVQSPLSVGLFAGKWCSYAATPDLPHDQREEDGGALVFETEPLEHPLELLGAPALELEFSADQPVAMAAARLSDVAPDGKATRVSYGMLNLTHRDGHGAPSPLEPDRRYRARVGLNDLGHAFPAGHRLRLSLSTSYFPLAWPSPQPVKLTVHTPGSRLLLPVRDGAYDGVGPAFGEPEVAETLGRTVLETGAHNWLVHRDLARDISTLEVIKDEGRYRLDELALEIRDSTQELYSYQADNFSSVRGEVLAERGLARGDWQVRTRTRTVLTCDPEAFVLCAELDAFEGDARVFCRTWNLRIPRKLL